MKFKKGDRIVVVKDEYNGRYLERIGRIGKTVTVERVDSEGDYWFVETTWCHSEKELELDILYKSPLYEALR